MDAGVNYVLCYEASEATSGTQGKQTVSGGTTGKVSVTFPSAFGTAPDFVTCQLVGPQGSEMVDARVVADSIATTGFDVQLSADVPGGTSYTLYWKAVETETDNIFEVDLASLTAGAQNINYPNPLASAPPWFMCQLLAPDTKAQIDAHVIANAVKPDSMDVMVMATDTGTYKLMCQTKIFT